MIILDKEDQQQEKSRLFVAGPTLRFPERVATRSLSPLPDYETSEAQHHDTVNKALLRKRGDSRFWRITFVVLAIYVALSLVIGVPLIVSVRGWIHSETGIFLDIFVESKSALTLAF